MNDCICFHWSDVRWFCPCGRFVAESSLKSGDEPDPEAYYGFTGWITAECSKCGTAEPECRPIKDRSLVNQECKEHGDPA